MCVPSGQAGKGKLGRLTMPKPESPPNLDLDDKCMMKFDDQGNEIEVRAQDLEKLEELGRGAYGVVEKMRHRETNIIMAVKRIHSSINDESQKRMLIELQACMKSDCCPQMVRFYGAMFREGDVWICMEVMDTSLDKFYRMTIDSGRRLPEMFIAKCALAVVEGLNFMKEQMNLIHRDVKPSNILLNKQGAVKICDFGISGHLTNSVAKTVNAGCKPYMPPERIEGEKKVAYDVRADVWSLGITLVRRPPGKPGNFKVRRPPGKPGNFKVRRPPGKPGNFKVRRPPGKPGNFKVRRPPGKPGNFKVRRPPGKPGNFKVEIASGSHPYAKWKTPFEQLKQVVHDAAPKLARSLGYSEYFEDFVAHCLTKDYNQRPKYPDLLAHAFLEAARNERHFDMGAFITEMMGVAERERESVLQGINMQAPVSATLGAMTLDAS
ncbi:Dual specificity mitogen-activated protein kinase kinase 6 [Toxocara canis]|uniref:mitogen-activated protein kinase kinase n=1 Tax=Toxocara canis TaxID=6265 RepID=A0A0B2UPI8_TOXCA|nr:Dual specificity mitogen-activated protein kinase kinase 6 [Toxocara canis]